MQPGQLLCDRYRIEQALARGGFGETFLAVDTHLPSKPQVVVKLLKPIHNDPDTLQIAQRLFNMEAETLEQLGKDNDRIPSLYAYFELKGEFYLVQEYIEGETLTKELDGRKHTESDTLAILKEILTGLTNVHREGRIHRDLKPDNIICRAKDRKLVLIDFGAVKQVRTATTNPNLVSRTINIGTPGYMPNEQGMGYPKPASDIYAVGAIGIQCLTGSHPYSLFDEDSLKLEWQHLCQVNRDFAKVLDRMVAPDYRQRYTNATEALDAIELLIPPSQTPPPLAPVPTTVIAPVPVPTKPARQPLYPPPPLRSPVNKWVKTPSKGIDRRNFFKWLGFGGVGVVSVLALSQIGKKPTDTLNFPTASSPSLPGSAPELTEIQFTSVKLNAKGVIIARPPASAQIYTEALGNGVDLKMVKIPGGKFMMGSPESEKDRESDESPQHQVTVPGFYLAQTLVTQAQYQAIMGKNPSSFTGNDKLPVEQVSWLNAVEFCEKLSQKRNRTYRLPSEAEWEYACRAGSNTPYAFGETINPSVVNYDGNNPYGGAVKGEHRDKTTPVGSFPPNLFGLYDMHGNLWEWCVDEWTNNYNGAPTDGTPRGDVNSRDNNKERLLRGGCWRNRADLCRSACHLHSPSSDRLYTFGFRVVGLPFRSS
jgi:eukaryotic-like serine/threonine-protein kinase